MTFEHTLISSVDELAEALKPVLDGEVEDIAFDTETTEVRDGYFTTYGTDLKMAGFSLSFGSTDLYVPVRHVAYDWRRREDLIARDVENDGATWIRRLHEIEQVLPEGHPDGVGFEPIYDPNVDLDTSMTLLALAFAKVNRIFMHEAPFDIRIVEREGLDIPWGSIWDTKSISVFTDPRPLDVWIEKEKRYLHGGHSLKHLGEVYLKIPADAQALLEQVKHALGKGSTKLNDYSMLPLRSAIAPYAAMDTRLTLDLADHMMEREAWKRPKVQKLLEEHREELPIILAMEKEGLCVNVALAGERAEAKRAERVELTHAMKQFAGRDVPVDAPIRLKEILYDELGIPRYRGNDDTREATLKHVRTRLVADGDRYLESGKFSPDMAKLIDAILDYRKVDKEINAFYGPLSKGDGVVHPILRQLGARTTRQTASKPNAHQMKKPKKGEDPRESIRHLIEPRPGRAFICADYAAQEMRGSAHFAVAIPDSFAYRFTWRCTLKKRGDCKGRAPHGPGEVHCSYRDNYSEAPRVITGDYESACMFILSDGFISEGTSFDPHQRMVEMVAAEGYDVSRDKCKNGNFAIIYGVGGAKLADMLNVPVNVAYALIRMFWDKVYPELGRVKLFISERLRKVGPHTAFSHQLSINTLHGAPIYLDDGYKGMNYLVQRSCREVLLKATIGCQRYIDGNGLSDDYRIALTVHDEIIFEVLETALEEHHVRALCRIMVEAGSAFRVPMVVEPKIARESWALKEKLPASWGYNGVTDVPCEEVTDEE